MTRRDSIFALSSGAPPAGIGVIRVSGPQARPALLALAGRVPPARQASLALLRDPQDAMPLDRALILWLPGPATVTGEDMVELHCHGGRAVIAAVEAALGAMPGLRRAEPGEFTRRAFGHGRMDLNAVEGLSDLLAAETQSQRRAALMMVEGHFSRRIDQWRRALLDLSAMAEAALDFSDEDDVPDAAIEARIGDGIGALAADVGALLDAPSAERLRDGVRVVLAGPPNAGKSTLLNALVGREAAIVSDIAGTTRDRIEVPAAIGGVAFLFTDTAGLREETRSRRSASTGRGPRWTRRTSSSGWASPTRSRARTRSWSRRRAIVSPTIALASPYPLERGKAWLRWWPCCSGEPVPCCPARGTMLFTAANAIWWDSCWIISTRPERRVTCWLRRRNCGLAGRWWTR